MPFESLTLPVWVSLWVTTWLHWTFRGKVRQFLFAYVFPCRWRGGRSRESILSTTDEDMPVFLALESQAPDFVTGALGCPGCLSAHVSVVGTLLAYGAFAPLQTSSDVCEALLTWAAGAWLGHRLYFHV